MIATLTGTISEKLAEVLVLEVSGIGYGLLVTPDDLSRLAVGETTKMYVHEHIRETSFDLYGFQQLDSLKIFEQLLNVNGIGPKMAINILSVGNADAVRAAIAAGDTKFIQAANGVGKKVAERIIVDLKDKVGLISKDGATDFLQGPTLQDDAVQALMALGFTSQDAALALQKVDNGLPTEERVRTALKYQGTQLV
jgi:holliday junction DNA helicase RuvA